MPLTQIVKDKHLMLRVKQLLRANAPDISRSACDKNFHGAAMLPERVAPRKNGTALANPFPECLRVGRMRC
jgi:hypothetical protein